MRALAMTGIRTTYHIVTRRRHRRESCSTMVRRQHRSLRRLCSVHYTHDQLSRNSAVVRLALPSGSSLLRASLDVAHCRAACGRRADHCPTCSRRPTVQEACHACAPRERAGAAAYSRAFRGTPTSRGFTPGARDFSDSERSISSTRSGMRSRFVSSFCICRRNSMPSSTARSVLLCTSSIFSSE